MPRFVEWVKRFVAVSDAASVPEPPSAVVEEPVLDPVERERRRRAFAVGLAEEAVRQFQQNSEVRLASTVIGGLGWLGAGLSGLSLFIVKDPVRWVIGLVAGVLFIGAGWNGSNLPPMPRGDESMVERKLSLGWRFLAAALVVGLIGICLSRI